MVLYTIRLMEEVRQGRMTRTQAYYRIVGYQSAHEDLGVRLPIGSKVFALCNEDTDQVEWNVLLADLITYSKEVA
jgi:hypothetical protein